MSVVETPAGSSPLTRGKLPCELVNVVPEGLIPAHAGKTSHGPLTGRGRTAHPRSRGENRLHALTDLPCEGSSPLTRGKLAGTLPGPAQARLIPAHAGKTGGRVAGLRGVRAHPRSRGENGAGTVDWAGAGGSSPLTRGKP